MRLGTMLVRRERKVNRAGILSVVLLLAGCGTYPLSGGALPPAGKTRDQAQLDLLVCQDEARQSVNSAGTQARSFALGLTVIGAPAAYDLEKKDARAVYAKCMTDKGYTVIPVKEENPQSNNN